MNELHIMKATDKGSCPFCDETAKVKKERPVIEFEGTIKGVACSAHFRVLAQMVKA
jgi:hypothetical protein